MITTVIVIAMALLVFAFALIFEARKAAKRDLRPFLPKPQSPSDADVSTLERIRKDSEIEAEWRRNVAENVARRADRKPPSTFLRRQAD